MDLGSKGFLKKNSSKYCCHHVAHVGFSFRLFQVTFRITSRNGMQCMQLLVHTSHSMHLIIVVLHHYVFSIFSHAGVVSLL